MQTKHLYNVKELSYKNLKQIYFIYNKINEQQYVLQPLCVDKKAEVNIETSEVEKSLKVKKIIES